MGGLKTTFRHGDVWSVVSPFRFEEVGEKKHISQGVGGVTRGGWEIIRTKRRSFGVKFSPY